MKKNGIRGSGNPRKQESEEAENDDLNCVVHSPLCVSHCECVTVIDQKSIVLYYESEHYGELYYIKKKNRFYA